MILFYFTANNNNLSLKYHGTDNIRYNIYT